MKNSTEPNHHAEQVRRRLRESLRVKEALLADGCVELVVRVAHALVTAYRRGGKVLLFGNGGSAADAQHLAAEFVGRYHYDRGALPALALHANTSALTAIANDYGYARVFARQVEALARPGDVVIGISTSGSSENVLEGLRAARAQGAVTVALTGADGGRLKHLADYCLAVPSAETPRIQEAHILLGHIVCELVEQILFPRAEEAAESALGKVAVMPGD